jgi:SET domain-containing protein
MNHDDDTPALPIEVRESAIHGKGAFAKVALRRGTRIGRYEGRRYSAEEAAERDWDQALTFVFGLSDGSVIDGSQGGNATRHINHSCAPNCVAYEMEPEDGQAWIEIETLRPIKAGAELFLDYQLDAGDSQPEDFLCACGTPACRSTMVAASP